MSFSFDPFPELQTSRLQLRSFSEEDYTMLNKNAKNFLKNMEVFDVRSCVQEIIEI